MKMHRKAMEEAVAAGWKCYDGEEESSEDEEGSPAGKGLWNTPGDGAPKSSESPNNSPLKSHELKTAPSYVGLTAESGGTSLQLFAPAYFDPCSGGRSQNPTSGSSEADDGESVAESQSEDGTALADKKDLHALLNELLLQSPPLPERSGLFSPRKESPRKGFSSFTPRYERSESSESTSEPTETETSFNEKVKDGAFQPPSTGVAPVDSDSCSMSSSDGEESEADSLDLGVSTTIWQSQEETSKFSSSNTNKSAKGAIANLVRMSNMYTPHASSPRKGGFCLQDETDGEESVNDTDDEQHEGNGVFLLTEGARYSGHKNGSANENDLFGIHEAKYQAFEAVADIFNGPAGNHENASNQFQPQGEESGSFLEFTPRFNDEDDGCLEGHLKTATLVGNSMNDADIKGQAQGHPGGDTCFGGIQLVSPKFFNNSEKSTKPAKGPPASFMSPLSSMVHPMNLELFDIKSNRSSIAKQVSNRSMSSSSESGDKMSVSFNPVQRAPTSVLQSEHFKITEAPDKESRRSGLASSFRSSTKTNRVAYNLSSGKKAMSKTQQVYSKSFLPSKPLLNPEDIPVSTRQVNTNHGTLSILLVDMRNKIFEVVTCDVNRETTVGDVLAKARSLATDPALSEQKYVSFCYGEQEFGAPMLPVHVVVDWEKHKTRPLVVAVPTGATSAEMRSVKRVLWKNPKMRGWWKQQDPFQPAPKKEKSARRAVTVSEKVTCQSPTILEV